MISKGSNVPRGDNRSTTMRVGSPETPQPTPSDPWPEPVPPVPPNPLPPEPTPLPIPPDRLPVPPVPLPPEIPPLIISRSDSLSEELQGKTEKSVELLLLSFNGGDVHTARRHLHHSFPDHDVGRRLRANRLDEPARVVERKHQGDGVQHVAGLKQVGYV